MLLTQPEIFQQLENYSDWAYEDGQLIAMYEFSDFMESLAFVNDCGTVFEEINHHATVIINVDQVTLMTWTQDVEWITWNDFALVEEISNMVE